MRRHHQTYPLRKLRLGSMRRKWGDSIPQEMIEIRAIEMEQAEKLPEGSILIAAFHFVFS